MLRYPRNITFQETSTLKASKNLCIHSFASDQVVLGPFWKQWDKTRQNKRCKALQQIRKLWTYPFTRTKWQSYKSCLNKFANYEFLCLQENKGYRHQTTNCNHLLLAVLGWKYHNVKVAKKKQNITVTKLQKNSNQVFEELVVNYLVPFWSSFAMWTSSNFIASSFLWGVGYINEMER